MYGVLYTYLVCLDVGSEPDVEGLDGVFHSLAMSSDDCPVQHCGGFGYIGDVFVDPESGQVCLRWKCYGRHCQNVLVQLIEGDGGHDR